MAGENDNSIESEEDVARLFKGDYVDPPKGDPYSSAKMPEVAVEVSDTEWEQWANKIEFKVNRQGQLVIGVALGLVVTLGFTVLMGRVVIKLVEGQKLIIQHLNTGGSDDPSGDGTGRSSRVSYTKPSNRVDKSGAVVDENLKADLEERMATSTEAVIPDELK